MRKSSQPLARARSSSPRMARAESTITGMLRERRVRLEAARGLPAVHARQREVHEDQVGLASRRAFERGLAVLGDHQAVAVLEQLHQQIAVELDVLDDEDGLHFCR